MNDHVTRARELAAAGLEAALKAGADEAEVIVTTGSTALTRFANNRIHQNVAERDTGISVRAVLGSKIGVASTNRLDPASLERCCKVAVSAAAASLSDEGFPGLPGPQPIPDAEPISEITSAFDADHRARVVASIIRPSSALGLTAAGGISLNDHAVAVANTSGVDVAAPQASIRATVLSMGDSGASGWASFLTPDAGTLDADALGQEAASIATRTRGAGEMAPGSYTVVLAPEAVADIVTFLGWMTFGAKPYAEKRSAFSDKLGQPLVDVAISISDDAYSMNGIGLLFDFEGQPRKKVPLIEAGVARKVVTDSYWASKLGLPNTGHALPAPNSYGPLPLNIVMDPGNSTVEELISQVERGVYVTRFHYVNVEDPVPVTLTGMTRDGTFLIENGRMTRPLKNLRFTQSAIEALSRVRGITSTRALVGDGGFVSLVPGLLIDEFNFTGQTA